MIQSGRSRWMVVWTGARAMRFPAALRLFCFPYAGGGAAAFRAWPDHLPPEVEVCAIQPPGRESRLAEPAIAYLARLIESLVEETRPYRDRPFALLGHSLGGLIAFELARALRRRSEREPIHLFVSGCCAPQRVRHDGPAGERLSTLADSALIARLRRYQGTPDEVLDHREMMSLMLPTIRADLGLRDEYVYRAESPLAVPITAWGGEDDADVSVPLLAAWQEQTSARFALRTFPGGHFFIHSARRRVLDALAEELAGYGAGEICPPERVAGGARAW